MTDESLFIPEPVFVQAVVDALGDGTFKVRVTPRDLTKYNVCTYTVRADSEDAAAKMGIDRYVETQQNLERLAMKGLPAGSPTAP